MSRLVGYTRRSTDHQDASPEVQERTIREFCERNGHELMRMYHEDPITGRSKVERRPVLSRLLSEIKSRRRDFDGLILYRMDRLFRNRTEMGIVLENFDRHHCEVHSATETIDRNSASGRFVAGIQAEVAEYEGRVTGERVYAHNLTLALSGRWASGRPPLGYNYDKQKKIMEANERADEAVKVFEEFINCGGNASKTARHLNARGMLSRDWHPWRDDSVLSIIKSAVYRQKVRYDGRESEASDAIPRIVPQELTDAADALLSRLVRAAPRQRMAKHVYSGFLVCAECGLTLKSNGNQYRGWVCRGRREMGICGAHSISEARVDAMVGIAVMHALKAFKGKIGEAATRSRKHGPTNAERERERLNARRKNLLHQHEWGLIGDKDLVDRMREVDDQIAALGKPQEQKKVFLSKQVESWMEKLSSRWGSECEANRRALLNALGARITVYAGDGPAWVVLETDLADPVRVPESEAKAMLLAVKRSN